jgi:hypothetical protein
MADKTVFYNSGGDAVNRTILGDVLDQQLVTDGIWAGITHEEGESGDVRALSVDGGVYQWYVPDGLTVNDGDTVYLEIADHTAGIPDDTAYSTSSGVGKIALFKALEAKVTTNGAGNHYVTGKSLLFMQGG